jgi:predicted nucleic acid-binding Zn ribbon protein
MIRSYVSVFDMNLVLDSVATIGKPLDSVKGKETQKHRFVDTRLGAQLYFRVMTSPIKRMDKPAPLGGILQRALKASNIDLDMELSGLWEQWTDLVGAVIAENARPAAIKGKLLLVNVSSAPWMQQLQYLKQELIQKLNRALGRDAVEEIRFKIGPVNDRSSLQRLD